MSAVSEWIVREYFETHGFLVRQPSKYQVSSRPKLAEEEIDLLVVNPTASGHVVAENVLWGAREIRQVARAVVSVRGWHTERISPKLVARMPELVRFADAESLKSALRDLGPGPVARILCLPDLPAARPMVDRTLEVLREKGIDGVLLFRTMLLELAAHVDAQKNYEKSDLLQLLRILKKHDLL
ncbi:MAG: hypothetical protein KKC51_13165, partial [Verrucomicrobia bacterium]|nr:hypothetical protein [Verrucomicrobiota bacterium]